jgi:hypothetical protein
MLKKGKMKKLLSQKLLLFSCIFIFLIASLIYIKFSAKIYSSKSHIAMFRLKIDIPDGNSEESRNRWIWIRDGLNLRSALLTDEMLDQIIKSNKTAAEISKNYLSNTLAKNYIRSLANIQFTGADENNFLIEVKAIDPILAYELNKLIFNRIKYLATDADKNNFNEVLQDIKEKQNEFKLDPDTYHYYQDKIRKMVFSQTIEQKQREKSFQIISPPEINDSPIWPNHLAIILTMLFLGFVFGLGLEYLYFFKKQNK